MSQENVELSLRLVDARTPKFATSATKCLLWVASGSGSPAGSNLIGSGILFTWHSGNSLEARAWLSHAEPLEAAGLREKTLGAWRGGGRPR
jgi:hypothetical protein